LCREASAAVCAEREPDARVVVARERDRGRARPEDGKDAARACELRLELRGREPAAQEMRSGAPRTGSIRGRGPTCRASSLCCCAGCSRERQRPAADGGEAPQSAVHQVSKEGDRVGLQRASHRVRPAREQRQLSGVSAGTAGPAGKVGPTFELGPTIQTPTTPRLLRAFLARLGDLQCQGLTWQGIRHR
jgi:hypothetical protein